MSETLRIAISGLNDAVLRVVNVASNVVNALSTGRLPESYKSKATSYQPQDVITLSNSTGNNSLGVHSNTKPREPAYVTISDPNSPNSNAQGLVAAPNVDISAELIKAKVAEVAYKANIAVIKAEQKNNEELLNTIV